MDQQLERNIENVKAFYDLAFNQGKPAEAVAQYVGDRYTQHNPLVADGPEAFIQYFTRMAKEYPGKKLHFRHAIAQDDYVVVHTQQEWPGDDDWATIDIFRLDRNGKIVEHWDTIQRVPKESANGNGMF